MITYLSFWGSAGTVTSAANSVYINLKNLDVVNNDTFEEAFNVSTGNTTYMMYVIFVTVTAANAGFTLDITAGQTTPTFADLYVTQLPNPVN